jgi:hypothetical protein
MFVRAFTCCQGICLTAFIAGAVTNIQSFKDQMPGMATQLTSIADKSIADSNADKANIQKLNDQLDDLRADIKSLTAAIVALGIADAAAITLGTVATIAAWPFGALAWLMMGPVVAVTTTYIALDAKKIVADKAAIEAVQEQIKDLDADVATLSVLANSYGALASSATSLESSLQSILAEWQSLESEVTQAVTEVQAAAASAGAHQFGTIAGELAGAVDAWNDASAQAGALHVDLVVNDAVLTLGMSTDDVSAALAGGQVTDVITYYNRITA